MPELKYTYEINEFRGLAMMIQILAGQGVDTTRQTLAHRRTQLRQTPTHLVQERP